MPLLRKHAPIFPTNKSNYRLLGYAITEDEMQGTRILTSVATARESRRDAKHN